MDLTVAIDFIQIPGNFDRLGLFHIIVIKISNLTLLLN